MSVICSTFLFYISEIICTFSIVLIIFAKVSEFYYSFQSPKFWLVEQCETELQIHKSW